MSRKKKIHEKKHQWEYERDKYGPKKISGHSGYVYYKKETKYWVLASEYTALFISLIIIILSLFSNSLGKFLYSLLIFSIALLAYFVTSSEVNHPILPILIIRKLQIRYTERLESKTSFDELVQECYYYSEKLKLEKRFYCEIRYAWFNIRKIKVKMRYPSMSYTFGFILTPKSIVFKIIKKLNSHLTKEQKLDYQELLSDEKLSKKTQIDVSIYNLSIIEIFETLVNIKNNVYDILPDYSKVLGEQRLEEIRLRQERLAKNKSKKKKK